MLVLAFMVFALGLGLLRSFLVEVRKYVSEPIYGYDDLHQRMEIVARLLMGTVAVVVSILMVLSEV